MLQKNACVIKRLPIHDVGSFKTDPDVAGFTEKANEVLGENGRFVIRLSGIPWENRVLAEGKNEEACSQCIEDFMSLLIKKGYYGS